MRTSVSPPACYCNRTVAMVLSDLYSDAIAHTLRVLGHGRGKLKVALTRQASARQALKASLAANFILLLLYFDGSIQFQWQKGWLRAALWPPPLLPPLPSYDLPQHIANQTAQASQQRHHCLGVSQAYLLPPQHREQLGEMLEAMGGFYTGVELGVQRALFSERMLSNWTSCRKYYLVDLWGHQENYMDGANVPDEQQELVYLEAQARLAPWAQKVEFIRSDSVKAASLVPDGLDWVYVDARHDYCGVKADIEAWWHKIRPGGILAGHDYRGAHAVWPKSDWSLCADGSRDSGAVMGAVNEWAMKHGLVVTATWGKWEWSSWMIRKPLSPVPCVISAAATQGRYQQRFWPWRRRRGNMRGASRGSNRRGDAAGVLNTNRGGGTGKRAGVGMGSWLLRGSVADSQQSQQSWPSSGIEDLSGGLQPLEHHMPAVPSAGVSQDQALRERQAGQVIQSMQDQAVQAGQVIQSRWWEDGGSQASVGVQGAQAGGWDDGAEQLQHVQEGDIEQPIHL